MTDSKQNSFLKRICIQQSLTVSPPGQEFQNSLFVKFREERTPRDTIGRAVLTSEGWMVYVLLLRIC